MSLETLRTLGCDPAFVSGFEARWRRRQADVLDALDYLHKAGLTEAPACIIAGNRSLSDIVAAEDGHQALGQHLNLYLQHVDNLSKEDQDAIRAVVIAADPSDQDDLSITLIYLNLLHIDMRDFIATRTWTAFPWEGVRLDENANFHMLLHNGLFGSDYQNDMKDGLGSIQTANQVAEYLTELTQTKPKGYDRILESYLSDTRLTQPDFLNPEPIAQIARQLLSTGQ